MNLLKTALAAPLLALAAATLPPAGAAPSPAPADTATAACPALLQQTFPRLQDEKPQNLCQYTGKVVVVVNTASYCGFTKQYQGLEDLYARYKDKGLVVLGFPSNDFGGQEPGSNKEIAAFCENTFGVKFPMLGKSAVSGDDANPLFKQLRAKTDSRPKWNFHKYVIARDGTTVTSYNSWTGPTDRDFVADIEQKLAKP